MSAVDPSHPHAGTSSENPTPPRPRDSGVDGDFARRHLGPSEHGLSTMVAELGFNTIDALIDSVVPPAIRSKDSLALPGAMSEPEVLSTLRAIAEKNVVNKSMIGLGYYRSHLPEVIKRNVLENPAWYTAYTPYQPEISQGRLEALVAFQTMVSQLCGLDIANASLLDEATAAAEAISMARRVVKGNGSRFFVDQNCHPQTQAVLETRARPVGIELVIGDPQL